MNDSAEIPEPTTGDRWDQVPGAAPAYDVGAILELDLYLRASFFASLFPAAWLSCEAARDFFAVRQDVAQSVMSLLLLAGLFGVCAAFLAQPGLRYKAVAVVLEGAGAAFFGWLAWARREEDPRSSLWFLVGALTCLPGILSTCLHYHYHRLALHAVLPEVCRGMLGRLFFRRRLVARLEQACAAERANPGSGGNLAAQKPWDIAEDRPR
ncbi:MAG TPA: hypothetical protein VL860_00685 [Planctomycetota bacterium]|nr:hypothetical protein [Planctomycetota bacterium]